MTKRTVAIGSGVAAAAALAGSAGAAQAKNNPPHPQITHLGSITSPFTDATYECNYVVNNGHPSGFYEWDPTPPSTGPDSSLNFAPCNVFLKP
jgi:hypothetical protein